eukprot:gene11849-11993_t
MALQMQHTSNTIRRRAVSTAVHTEGAFLDELQQHRGLFEPLQVAASSSDPHHVQGRLRSGRRSALVRSAAFLQNSEPEETYDDLLALDQFNVKRAVKPSVVAALPRRLPEPDCSARLPGMQIAAAVGEL